ncbi:DUF480 domain-containing protein [Oxalobacteraceae bacterium OM1]|nr:DUF480 domain-containing protein [Oxalobacteraceae bacterium OM1]
MQEQGDGVDQLDDIEVRVLAVLAEKEALTPDAYPMSLNALVNGCNQLSSRDPVMALNESDVVAALDRLVARRLAAEVRQAGARVVKYEHRMRIMWTLEPDKLAALVLLMLRGPQTAGEVRGRAGRVHEFKTVADAEAALQFLIDKYPPLVARLPVAPGTKEARYVHLLSGEAPAEAISMRAESSRQDRITALESDVATLRANLETLREEMQRFRAQFE